ncbi:MAG TPA: AI-2E family transporter [Chloroflexaceae bacterium]|nr:AI-2E family transporter [Chloroflexaceae bacterium]
MGLFPPRHSSILRPLLIAASVVLVLGAMRIGAPILNPLLLALVITLLCNPIYLWLQRRGLSSWLALLLMVSAFLSGAIVLVGFIGVSLSQLTSRLGIYQALLTEQELALRTWLAGHGLVAADLQFFGLLNSVNLTRILGVMLTGIGNVLGNALLVVVLVLFFLVELPAFQRRLRSDLGEQSPLLGRLRRFGGSVLSYFGIRTYINLVVALGSSLALAALAVPFTPLWGMLIFLLSYIPYIGIPIAALPAVLLALAEHGPVRAGLVILAVTVINSAVENLVAPAMIGRRLSLSPAVVFVAFFFWTWLLGPPGTFLSMPITVLLTVLLDSYEETRWLARLMGSSSLEALGETPAKPVGEPLAVPVREE